MFACRHGNDRRLSAREVVAPLCCFMETTNMPTEPEKKPLEPTPTQPGDAIPDGGGHNEPPKQVITRADRL